EGILRLAELGVDAEPGTDAIALLGLDDWAIEGNVTPDRGYALSVRGIAREYSHATGAAFRDPADISQAVEGSRSDRLGGGALVVEGSRSDRLETTGTSTGFPVTLNDSAPIHGRPGCTLFATQVVRGVDPSRPSPPWMVSRLTL